MDASTKGCLVKVDTRPYRVIAQENWGLSDEQMRGMHVHHRIPVSQGGTNDPTNLYVCSPSFHAWVWHNGLFKLIINSTEVARLGGLSGGPLGGTTSKNRGVGIFAPGMQSLGGSIGGPRGVEAQRVAGTGLFGLSAQERSSNTKRQWEDPEYNKLMRKVSFDTGKKMAAMKIGIFADENLGRGARTTNSTLWADPDHPELGAHHFNTLKKIQKRNGHPCERNNRVKVAK